MGNNRGFTIFISILGAFAVLGIGLLIFGALTNHEQIHSIFPFFSYHL